MEEKRRLQAIIETAIDGIITIDAKGVMDTVNPAAARIFGYHPEQMVGQNVSMLMPEPHRSSHDGYLSQYLSTGNGKIIGVGREVLGLKSNGDTFPFRLAVGEVKIKDGKRFFTGIIHDLTREKQHAEELERYAAELERSNRELENFAYISSHDLQEPLRKIQAFGSRISEREGDKLSQKGQDYLGRMLSASSRLQRLIDDLLAFSRISSRAKPFQQVNLNEVIAEVLSDLDIAIAEAKGKIEGSDLPTLEGDEMQMHQLFQNLISNAIKFRHPERLPQVKVGVEELEEPVSQAYPIRQIKITVQDNGIGFDEKYLDRIFNIFQRLEGQKYQGSGIGLAICRKIVQRHHGSLDAFSQPGEGARFEIILPLKQIKGKARSFQDSQKKDQL